MAVCSLRTILLIVCILELILTVQRQVFDFLGYMWLPIIANFTNILLIIFGSFGAVQCITKYLLAYAIWSFIWLTWNLFLICYYLNLGVLNRESGLLSLGTGSVSWWEGNGWGCQPVWDELDRPGIWRPTHVEGCFLQWYYVELGQSVVAAVLTGTALPLAILLAYRLYNKEKTSLDKGTLSRRPVYTIELSSTETNANESSLKPMTPRRVKRRSGSRGTNSSVRRSRRSYRNAGYMASTSTLPRDSRLSRPTSAHSSYSNFHGTRPTSYHAPEREETSHSQDIYNPPPPSESVTIMTNRYDKSKHSIVGTGLGHDVVGPYKEPGSYDPAPIKNESNVYDPMSLRNDSDRFDPPPPRNYEANISCYDNMSHDYGGSNYNGRLDMVSPCESPSYGASAYGVVSSYPTGENGWDAPPPPAPPYSARATPQAPGPPAYQPVNDTYNVVP